MTVHPLLRRQLKRLRRATTSPDELLERLVGLVDTAYQEFDADRRMVERSLELSSHELLQANSEMRAVFNAFPDLYFVLNSENVITNVVSGRDSDLHTAASRVLGQSILAIPDSDVSATFKEAIERVRGGEAVVEIDYSLDIRGTVEHYEARLLPLVHGQLFVVVRNVTEQRQQQEDRLRASKLDSLALLAGGIAHDFNNILTAVLGNVSLAILEVDEDGEVAELLQETEQATLRARHLTQQLLMFSRSGAPIRSPRSVAHLLRESATFCLRGSKVSCEFRIDEDLSTVEIDEGQISQVINNLVINASQAMPDGGTLILGAENVRNANGYAGADSCVRIYVIDEGTGIAPEFVTRIFDPYFTTKERGSGLGLATSYSIVKRHGGEITVDSIVGRGTRFDIYLPACDLNVEETEKVSRNATHGSGRILVMDDEAPIRVATKRILRRLGYKVSEASDGLEAVEAFRAAHLRGQPFDLVIMDLTVPGGMGGQDAIRRIREIAPHVKAVATSGYCNDPVIERFREYGFSGALSKPFDLHQLGDVVHALV